MPSKDQLKTHHQVSRCIHDIAPCTNHDNVRGVHLQVRAEFDHTINLDEISVICAHISSQTLLRLVLTLIFVEPLVNVVHVDLRTFLLLLNVCLPGRSE